VTLEKGGQQMKRRAKHRGSLVGSVLLASLLVVASTVMAVDIGAPAPDFTLQSTMGEKVSLSQFKGKKHVLIQFYSTDFNPT
jgi:cytochrome oxidase Cu insertion factor (SCO1/SenC/PrrC family)